MYLPNAGPTSDFSVDWDGQALYSENNVNPPRPQNWTQYDFTVTGTGSDTLTFLSRQDPSYQGLDNVSVTEVSSSGPTLTLSNGATATYSGISNNGETLDFTYRVAPGGDTPALTVGSVNLNSASVTDAAGNQLNTSLAGISQSGPQIDTTAPNPPTISDSAVQGGYVNAVNDTPVQALTGTAEANSTVNVYLGGSTTPAFTTTADATGAWSQTVGALADGTYSYTATATDAAGNTSNPSAALTLTVDTATSESAISDTAVTNSYINAVNFNGWKTTLTGVAEPGDVVLVAVTVNNGTTTTTTTKSATVLPDGS